jgi:hypothetical protein
MKLSVKSLKFASIQFRTNFVYLLPISKKEGIVGMPIRQDTIL